MSQSSIPESLAEFVTQKEWGRSGIIGHKSTLIEYPDRARRLLEKKIFSFDDLTQFEWQELQALLINALSVEELVSANVSPKTFHLYDAPQLIEILHNPKAFVQMIREEITAEELAKFSGYQLKLVLNHPESMAAILKNFEGVEDLLKLKWNWIEEMLMRPEDALALLVYGVEWDQIDHLQAWDFGWFLNHRHEIMRMLEFGIEFDVIAHLNAEKLRLAPAFAPLFECGVSKKDLENLDFYQLFMLLSHREVVVDFFESGMSKEDLFSIGSVNMEQLLEDPRATVKGFRYDPNLLKQVVGMRPVKIGLLLRHIDNYGKLVEGGVQLSDLKPLIDDQYRLVLSEPDEFIPIVDLAVQFHLPKAGPLNLDLRFTQLMNAHREKLGRLLSSGLTFDDLTRFPLIFPDVLQYAENIIRLSEQGTPTEEIFHLSKDQIQYAFSRFPLLEILPEIGLTVKDIQPYMIEEFKVVMSHLKAFSMLKKGGVDMKVLTQIKMPHLEVILKYPEYVLSLTEKGIPLYKFDLLDSHKLTTMLKNPLTPEAQHYIQELMQK